MKDCKIKKCIICQKMFKPVSGRQLYCVLCRKIERKKSKHRNYMDRCEYYKLKRKEYRLENKEKIDFYEQENYLDILERGRKYSAKYRLLHHEETLISVRRWRQTEHGKKVSGMLRAKRERELGYIILNKWFKGCEGHHIDKNYVIFIPRKLHGSIYHSVFKDRNMDQINQLAFNWLSKWLKK